MVEKVIRLNGDLSSKSETTQNVNPNASKSITAHHHLTVDVLQTAVLSYIRRFTCMSLTEVCSRVLVSSEVDCVLLVDWHW